MADSKIESLTQLIGIPTADDLLLLINDPAGTPAARKITLAQLAEFLGDSLSNQSVADQTINAATTAYLVGSNIVVPASKVRVGTIFKWKLSLSKTGAGTAANTFDVRVGTAGTTADASRLAFTTGTATAVIDQGQIDIMVTVRNITNAAGSLQGIFNLSHELASTGLHNKATRVQHVTSAAVDLAAANLIFGLSCTTGASTVLTFQQVFAEAKNL